MGVARHITWSARSTARRVLCLMVLLAVCSGACAAVVPEKKHEAHHLHHASKAKLTEQVAAVELATRERYEAKVTQLELTTETLRRDAEEQVADLSKERNELVRNITRYKKGLLSLDAKRKTETDALRLETERLKREAAELHLKLEEALDTALRATKSANEARAAWRGAATTEKQSPEKDEKDVPESALRAVVTYVFGVLSRGYTLLHKSVTRVTHVFHPGVWVRNVACFAFRKGWLPLDANASLDDAAAFVSSVCLALAVGAASAKGPAVAEFILKEARAVRVKPPSTFGNDGGTNSTTPPSAWRRNSLFDDTGDSDEFELVDDDDELFSQSPTFRAAVNAAANAFDSSPDEFEKSPGEESGETRESETETEEELGVSASFARLEPIPAKSDDSPIGQRHSTDTSCTKCTAGKPVPAATATETPVAKIVTIGVDASPTPSPRASPVIANGALKTALRKLAAALATPRTNAKVPVVLKVSPKGSPPFFDLRGSFRENENAFASVDAPTPAARSAFFPESDKKQTPTNPPVSSTPKRISIALVLTPAPCGVGGQTPGSGDSASSAEKNKTTSRQKSKTSVTPRDRMNAYTQKLRRGVDVELPSLDTPTAPSGGDTYVAGGVRHAKGWAS